MDLQKFKSTNILILYKYYVNKEKVSTKDDKLQYNKAVNNIKIKVFT